MQYLLDTHILIWWLTEPQKIPTKTQKIIENRQNKIFVSSVSLWEIALKHDINKLTMPANFLDIIKQNYFDILPLKAEESLMIVNLPKIHKDPFDRMLISQGIYNKLPVITKDKNFAKYPGEYIFVY